MYGDSWYLQCVHGQEVSVVMNKGWVWLDMMVVEVDR